MFDNIYFEATGGKIEERLRMKNASFRVHSRNMLIYKFIF